MRLLFAFPVALPVAFPVALAGMALAGILLRGWYSKQAVFAAGCSVFLLVACWPAGGKHSAVSITRRPAPCAHQQHPMGFISSSAQQSIPWAGAHRQSKASHGLAPIGRSNASGGTLASKAKAIGTHGQALVLCSTQYPAPA